LQEYLKPDNTLKEAANLLRIAQRGEEKIGVKALPVLDTSGNLAGNTLHRRHPQGSPPSYMDLMNLGSFAWMVWSRHSHRRLQGKRSVIL